VLNKGVAARELFETIRGVEAGERVLALPSAALLHETHTHIADEDRALVGMLLDGASETEAARTLGQATADVRHAVQRILRALRQSAPVIR
jgi:hypothetical protein